MKVLKTTSTSPYFFINFTVAHNGHRQVNNFFDRIELQTTEMYMLKAVLTKVT